MSSWGHGKGQRLDRVENSPTVRRSHVLQTALGICQCQQLLGKSQPKRQHFVFQSSPIHSLNGTERIMAQAQTPPSHPSLLVTSAGSPPKEWIKTSHRVQLNARIISLWETTVFLIRDEAILGQDQQRFLAMIHDHKASAMLTSVWGSD